MNRLLLVPVALAVVLAAYAADDQPRKKDDQPNKKPAAPPGPSADEFLKRFDKDGDGKLSREEVPPRPAEGFARLDRNGDGYLDRAEIAQMLQVLRKGPPPPDGPPSPERIVKDMLARLDANKDGKISKDEARGPLAENFDRFDLNKDGVLDARELRAAAERLAAAVGPRPGPDFDALDKDADGRLTREELRGTPFADRFDALDANKDGKLTRKEFESGFKKD